jgi:hypothetical protein
MRKMKTKDWEMKMGMKMGQTEKFVWGFSTLK